LKKIQYIFLGITLFVSLSFRAQEGKLDNIPPALQEYNVALFLPLYLHDPVKRKNDTTKVMYDYYEGVQAALTDLEKMGMKMRLHVFDDEGDMHIVDSIFKLPKMMTMNTIVGPLFNDCHQVAERFCGFYKIPLVSPIKFYNRSTKDTFPHLNMIPSDSVNAFGEGLAISRCYPGYQLVVVSDNSAKFFHQRKLFRDGFSLLSNTTITNVVETDLSKLNEMMLKNNRIIVYAPTENVAVLTKLAEYSKNSKIILALPKSSKSIVGFGKAYMVSGKVHFGDDNVYDIYEDGILAFRKMYRERFHWEANIYHFTAYDQFMFIGQGLMAFHQLFPDRMGNNRYFGVMNHFLLHPVASGSFENAGCKIVRYSDKDTKVEVPQR